MQRSFHLVLYSFVIYYFIIYQYEIHLSHPHQDNKSVYPHNCFRVMCLRIAKCLYKEMQHALPSDKDYHVLHQNQSCLRFYVHDDNPVYQACLPTLVLCHVFAYIHHFCVISFFEKKILIADKHNTITPAGKIATPHSISVGIYIHSVIKISCPV